MNLGSKGKKRVVLPSRPEPPTVEQILEDVSSSTSDDPLFRLQDTDSVSSSSSGDAEVELKFERCRRFMELNHRLTEAREQLKEQREELRASGERLKRDIQEVKTRMQTQEQQG
ncbi:UPF0449 protein C19orf25 homolog isoform X2 [Boleophthalmus pectinirostris]|nr:UPF0449 protein C19orf25 homolog isoform X2 [Boleophthalmus pectinirostris]XP_055021314.1 UPF0449 protein C19orf25 homolog isoform X2 [Boleophthalmus pectinirostris]